MNFLAHAWLAGERVEDRLGALVGDFVKGPLPGALSPSLATGVELHRRIDAYADHHPAFLRSRQRVSMERRRYSGIMVDMFYDHFLARHWRQFSDVPLAEYVAELYAQADSCRGDLPVRFHRTLDYMQQENWLYSYRMTESIALTLDRLSQYRLRQPNRLGGGGAELLASYVGFEADFFDFIADARCYSDTMLAARIPCRQG